MAAPSSRPLRVLITADAMGGVWTHVESLVRAFKNGRSGPAATASGTDRFPIDCAVAVLGPAAPPSDAASSATYHLPCRLEWMQDPWADVRRSGAWLRDLAHQFKADVVHVNGFAHAACGFDVPVVVGAHSCVCSWWRAVHGTAAPPQWDPYRLAVKRGLGAASAVVAPSKAMLMMLETEHGALPNGEVIHNGARSHPLRADTEPLVVSVGRFWDDAKNLRVLDAAASDVRWPIVVLGPTTGPDGRTHRPRHVRAVGPQPPRNVRRWLARARIYAHPARYEPFGLAVLEAAQAGCALVLSDLPSLREIWGPAAVYVPSADARAWAEALGTLIDDEARRTVLANAARRVARRYSVSAMARRYARVYTGLARRRDLCVVTKPAVWSLTSGAVS